MAITITRLAAEDELSTFDCGDEILNRYLLCSAKENQALHSVGVTYIARDEQVGSTVLGYHTLAVASVPKDPIKHMFGPSVPPYHVVPCVLLARLAVQQAIQRKGVGRLLLRNAFETASTVKASVGCRLMIVDAYPAARTFYEQYGFMALSDNPKSGTIKMFLDLNTVEAAQKAGNL